MLVILLVFTKDIVRSFPELSVRTERRTSVTTLEYLRAYLSLSDRTLVPPSARERVSHAERLEGSSEADRNSSLMGEQSNITQWNGHLTSPITEYVNPLVCGVVEGC